MSEAAVYGTFAQAELDAEYDTAVTALEPVPAYLERCAELGAAARIATRHETLRYGAGEREIVDLVAPSAAGAPFFMWIHGGYWRRLSKDDFWFVAPPLAARGAAVALTSYPLAPGASLDEIVSAVRRAFAVASERAIALGADPARLLVGGHSVGAQLAAMIAATAPVRGVFALSGLYDLEPVRRSKVNETIAMDPESARRNSPLVTPPMRRGTLAIAAGGRESAEFARQSREYAAAWRSWGGDVRALDATGDDHFSIALELARADSPLARALGDLVFASD